MIITFDTEFHEDGRTIELLSIGLVRADGAEYYAEPAEADRKAITESNPWVAENVLPYLSGPVKPRAQIASEIVAFAGPNPSFWAWYGAYDWVALCQLYGTMLDLPRGWPMFVHDLRWQHDPARLPEQTVALDGFEHHALADARWLMRSMRATGALG